MVQPPVSASNIFSQSLLDVTDCMLTTIRLLPQAVASVDREEMFLEHMKERERRKRAEEKAARKRKLQDFRELLERSSGIKVRSKISFPTTPSFVETASAL